MRLTPVVLKRGWFPPEKVQFQELLPLKLKNSVSGKSGKTNDLACIQEMTILFACLKKNNFNQQVCSNEINVFQKCYKDFTDEKIARKDLDRKGIISAGSKNLNHKQVSQLLSKYP